MGLNKLTFGLFNDTKTQALALNKMEVDNLKTLNLKDIIVVDFPDDQYYKQETKKNQIVLHHTVSGVGVAGDIAYWRSTVERIGTAVIIGWDGKIYQCFSSKYWAHHIGSKLKNNKQLNMNSIGIEIDSWGGLIEDKKNGEFYPALFKNGIFIPNKKVSPIKNVQIYKEKYRGFYAFEKYTNEQIESLRKLLVYWGDRYNIPLIYNPSMFDVSNDAISGKSGIWSHTSYRRDKSDIHPQPELIDMLKSL